MHATARVALHRHPDRLRAGGQHQAAVGQGLRRVALRGVHAAACHVDAIHLGVRQQGHLQGVRHFGRRGADQLFGGALLREGVGQRGFGVKIAAVTGDHHHRRGGVELAELAHRGPACQTRADDDEGGHI